SPSHAGSERIETVSKLILRLRDPRRIPNRSLSTVQRLKTLKVVQTVAADHKPSEEVRPSSFGSVSFHARLRPWDTSWASGIWPPRVAEAPHSVRARRSNSPSSVLGHCIPRKKATALPPYP